MQVNKYIQLTKIWEKYKKKYEAVIQCKIWGSFSIQNPIFSDIKRVYYSIITVGKFRRFAKCRFVKCRSSRPQFLYRVGIRKVLQNSQENISVGAFWLD